MKKFKTVETAVKEVAKRVRKYKFPFCPLTQESCVSECVCHKDAHYNEVPQPEGSSGPRFYVYKSGCTNAMFTGNVMIYRR